ncbi:MAG: amidohydrolase [Candidatus Hermodarchaeota archaeon]|nr:amidohydrolase [Candidatus Hermodarchaeota archaeon]
MRTLIQNAIIITMDPQRRVLTNTDLLIEDSVIASFGKGLKEKADRVIDGTGRMVLPGFICGHTHLYGIMLRGAPMDIKPTTDFLQILDRIWWKVDSAFVNEDAYASALASCYEFVKSGTTCFADTYSGPGSVEGVLDEIAKGVTEVGIRGILAFEATERNSKEEGERGLKENVRFLKKLQKSPHDLLYGMYSLHASFTLSDELIQKTRDQADQLPAPLTIHTSEGLIDVYHNIERYDKRTVERLFDLGILGSDVVLAHCVHVNHDELELIRGSGATVAHNPMSNMNNAVGVAPIKEMYEHGISVCLGNDGFIFDAIENIRTAYLIHKVHHLDTRVTTPQQVIEMATINGAQAYGLADKMGSIEAGKQADLVMLHPNPRVTPILPGGVYGYIIYGCTAHDVEHVFVNGNQVVEDHQVTSVKQEDVEKALDRVVPALWKKLGIDV